MTDTTLLGRVLAAYKALSSGIIDLEVVSGRGKMAAVRIWLGHGGKVAVRAEVQLPEPGLDSERFFSYDGALVSYYDGDPAGQYFQVGDSTGGRRNFLRVCDISRGLHFLSTFAAFLASDTSSDYNQHFKNTLRYSQREGDESSFVVQDEEQRDFIYQADPESLLLVSYQVVVDGQAGLKVDFSYSRLGQPVAPEVFLFVPPPGTSPR